MREEGADAGAANTDTKWYWDLTSNIYRFVPASTELIKNFHTVDERCVRSYEWVEEAS